MKRRKEKEENLNTKHWVSDMFASATLHTPCQRNLLLEPSSFISLLSPAIFLGSVFTQNQVLLSISSPLPNAKTPYKLLIRDVL